MQTQEVPILLLVFNRPEVTQHLMLQLQKVKPKQLFVGADGPREHKKGEKERCDTVRQLIEKHINWDCELKTLYREQNLGCRQAVSSAIDWFFEEVEFGIILEDDCIPNLSFFSFCQELLLKYGDDEKVMHITGHNPAGEIRTMGNTSYFFTRQISVWGWATWRRAWQKMDVQMTDFEEYRQSDLLQKMLPNPLANKYVLEKWEKTYKKEINSWAYAWWYSMVKDNGQGIMSSVNLIKNIGFSEDATHTNRKSALSQTIVQDLDLPLIHPKGNDLEILPKREQKIFYGIKEMKALLFYYLKRPSLLWEFFKKS
ncbi:MAG: hypothetical protein MK212_09345 [Saprospiraceae bacterium]|nr:hypothetical protein [Saprospiraceae bacterium]